MSRVQTSPDAFVDQKKVEQRVSRLERLNFQTELKTVDTAGLTNSQIDAAVFSNGTTPSTNAQPNDGIVISDPAGYLLLRQNAVWDLFVPGVIPVGWTNVTYYNGWTGTVQYRRDANNVVWLRGSCSGGTSGSVSIVLPAGFRPGVDGGWATIVAANADGQVLVHTNGQIQMYVAAGYLVYLDPISFLAEN